MTNPYQPLGPITNVNHFIGRQEQIIEMAQSLFYKDHAISINLVGHNQYGKTSLLKHFADLVRKYTPSYSGFEKIVYFSLQDPRLHSPSALISSLYKQIINLVPVDEITDSSLPLDKLFPHFTELLQECPFRVIVLIDELEVALTNPTAYKLNFWYMLRELCQGELSIAFVLSSQLPLLDYWQLLEHLKMDPTSPLFNCLRLVKLDDFNQAEIEDFFSLSDIRFSWDERSWILKYAGGNPHRLQVASYTLYNLKAERQHLLTEMEFKQALSSASETYQVRIANVKSERIRKIMLVLIVVGLLAFATPLLGAVSKTIGDFLDSLVNTIVGAVLVLLLILVLFGKFPIEKIREYIERILGIKKE